MVDFLVIGPRTGIIYDNIFPFIKERRIMLGNLRKDISFGDEGISCRWFQNIREFEIDPLPLKEYKEGEYDCYDHFDAINTEKIEDIPDCDLVIGVPVSFIDKWDYRQFDIVDARDYRKDVRFRNMKVQLLCGSGGESSAVNGERKFSRISIKKK
jgi:hypothetical protein